MIVHYGDRSININTRKLSFMGRFFGLMFREKNTENFLFEFKKETKIIIHSYFVFFDFLAIWLDKGNRVVDWRIVKPFTAVVRPKAKSFKMIEVPLNKSNHEIIDFFRKARR